MMTENDKRPSAFVVAMAVVLVGGIVTGVLISGNMTGAMVGRIAIVAVVFGLIGVVAYRGGAAFQQWLQGRWYE